MPAIKIQLVITSTTESNFNRNVSSTEFGILKFATKQRMGVKGPV